MAIAREVRLHRNEIRGCYQRELIRNPQAQGQLDLTFIIHADGWTDGVAVASADIASDALARCIERRVLRWRFPTSDTECGGGRIAVRYHYRLTASGERRSRGACYSVTRDAAGLILELRTRGCDPADARTVPP